MRAATSAFVHFRSPYLIKPSTPVVTPRPRIGTVADDTAEIPDPSWPEPVRPDGRSSGAALDLSALLSRVLLAFTIQFERESRISLPISANTLRVLGGQGVRLRDLPRSLIRGSSGDGGKLRLQLLYLALEPHTIRMFRSISLLRLGQLRLSLLQLTSQIVGRACGIGGSRGVRLTGRWLAHDDRIVSPSAAYLKFLHPKRQIRSRNFK